MTSVTIGPTFHSTRFSILFYAQVDRNLWRFFVRDSDNSGASVGPHYRTKAELLGDLTRYATEYGLEA